ncbi:hypothetical protein FOL47_003104 [Perkinsus chesapeaki]|uniref:Uncharacterized protein n=1 Tax=Perkinsus chesapeaki TaxID=330153 RepID=A0A7J6M9P3_PERCH|nr:hypothetical protein FOL47_003104 [Perkinsus chesapeaki]
MSWMGASSPTSSVTNRKVLSSTQQSSSRQLPVRQQQQPSSYNVWCLSDGTPFNKGLCYPVHYASSISLVYPTETTADHHYEFPLEPPSRPQGWSIQEWRIACDAVADGITTTIFKRV